MDNYSQGVFQYDGRFYLFGAAVFHENAEYPLDNNAVGMFQYASRLNDLTFGGSLVYTDNYGVLDSIFKGGRAVCRVFIYQGETQNEVMDAANQGMSDKRVQFDFFVDSMEILSRAEQTVRYRLNLVSVAVEKCLRNVRYSNFAEGPEPGLEIFRKCASGCELGVDQAQFKTLGSGGVKIKYVSAANDNLFSVRRYIFDKMYSYGELESSMKFVYYDFGPCLYRVFDMAKPADSSVGVREIAISQQQNGAEGLFQSAPVDIGAPASFSQVDQIVAFRKKLVWKYDFSSNAFSPVSIDTSRLNGVYNARPDNAQARSFDFLPVFADATADYSSEWNNSLDVHAQLANCLFCCKSIRIDVGGDIYCRTGYAVNIIMDNVMDVSFDDPPSKAHDESDRYQGFGGVWYVQGVHGYFDMQRQEFKQVLTLVRSYVVQ